MAQDRRVAVRVDRQDALGGLAADDVLDRAADAAGDVQVRRDPRRRSGRSARRAAASRRRSRRARRRPRRRAAPASSSSIAKPSALPTPRPPPTTTRASASEILRSPTGPGPVTRTRRSRSVRVGVIGTRLGGRGRADRLAPRRRRAARRSAGAATVEPGLLEQAAAPPLAGDLPRSPGSTSMPFAAIGQAGPGADVGQDLGAALAAGARSTAAGAGRAPSCGEARGRGPRARSRRGAASR